MSRALETRAEIIKLARLLRRDPDQLAYLQELQPADVRWLHDQTTEVLFTAHGPALGRLAAASKLLPVGLIATIEQRTFGPVLSARITGMLEPSRAVDVAAKLPVEFLADVAIELDPRRASDVIGQIPARQIADVTRELIRREEYVTMGRFIGHLGTQAIRAALAEIDDRSLLHVAFVLESKESLEQLVAMLAPERIDGILDAASSTEMWPEALDLFTHLSDEQRATIAERAAEREEVLDEIIRVAIGHGLWDAVMPLVLLLPDHGQARIAAIVETLDPEQQKLLVGKAAAAGVLTEQIQNRKKITPPGGFDR